MYASVAARRCAARPVVVINDGDSVDLTHSITSGRTVQQLIYNTDACSLTRLTRLTRASPPGHGSRVLGGPRQHLGFIISIAVLT